MNQAVAAVISESITQSEPAFLGIKLFGRELTEIPKDLYIPPEALLIFLEAFEGPLDLLLYLIKKQNIDILDLPVLEITRQYMSYVEVMQELQFELAAEYLVMAATLAEIKSRLLLPRSVEADGDEEGNDPRAELIRRLQEYERFKIAAENIDQLPRMERDVFDVLALPPKMDFIIPEPDIAMDEILRAFQDVLKRAKLYASHQVGRQLLSIRERMTIVLDKLTATEFTEFCQLFTVEEGRIGVVVSLIAILELVRQSVLELVQPEPFAPIYVKKRSAEVYVEEDAIDE